MVHEWLTKFVALHIDAEGTSVALTGKLESGFARILDETTAVPSDPQQTHFAIQVWPEDASALTQFRAMTVVELKQLANALKGQEHHVRTTVDATLFLLFLQQLDVELGETPSRRFAKVIFRDISADARGITAHYALSGDVVGTIHCADGALTVEQHVAPLPAGRVRGLRRADRLSLASALDAWIERGPRPVDPLWAQLAREAKRS